MRCKIGVRFPRIGEVALRGATLELRHALEPWHVLGEEPAGGGTARFVDSSVERVQALVSGWGASLVGWGNIRPPSSYA